MPVPQGSHKTTSESEVPETFPRKTHMPFIQLRGSRHLQLWSQTEPAGVETLVDSVRGDGDVGLSVLAHQLAGVKLLGESLLEPGFSEDTTP